MASAGLEERREEQRVLVVLRHGAIEERALPPVGTLTIGRDETADVTIGDRSVSRHHATLRIDADGVVTVADEGSRNGTTAGGRRVGREPVVVAERETLVFGDVACHLMTTRRSAFRSDLRLEPAEFDRRLTHEGERALRYEHSVSVLAIRFAPGDAELLGRALRAVSSNLTDLDLYVARDADAVDVMLVETDRAEARVEAERLAAALVEVHPARIGVATFPGDSPSPALLGAAADLAARGAAGPGVHPATDAVRVLRFGDREVIVADRAMHRVFGLIERVAPTELSVLFTGETGTGKEVAATALHALGPRKRAPLVSLNCAALPEQLLESELFGHERGAFSGAVVAKPGLFEQAAGGTLFLDEIGEMSPPLQAKLLRVLETKRLRRVGGVDERAVDVRVVSATHRDLDREVATGGFRADLLYRLRGMQIELPPLRARPHEIPILAARFVAEAMSKRPAKWSRKVDALVLSSPALDPGMNAFQKFLLAVLGPLAPGLAVNNGLKPEWISRDPGVVRAYVQDPMVHDRVSPRLVRFIVDEGLRVQSRAARWKLPTLLLWAGADRCVAPSGSANFAAVAPIDRKSVV